MSEKGFVTVATGSEKYYKLAYNLCLSYKKRGKGKYPFAIICDKVTEYTEIFDDIVIVDEIKRSTLDKLLMIKTPYEESLFIDADTLILDTIDDLWDVFAGQDDVSVFGRKLPLDSQDGWFTYEGSGKYKPYIKYLISMNGGIYYIKKSDLSEKVFEKAAQLIDEYSTIDFKYFSTPADEPLMAMSMVLNECAPCNKTYDMIILPACDNKIKTDYHGNIYRNRKKSNDKMIHFSTRRTELYLYNYLNSINYIDKPTRINCIKYKLKYFLKDLKFNTMHNGGAVLRSIGMDKTVDKLKKAIG